MISTTFMRFVRLAIAIISGGALALFVIVLCKVLDPRFPSDQEGITSLPIFGLGASIIYNVTAFIITPWLSSKRIITAVGDFTIAAVVATLGAIGWTHDNKHYLSNGMWEQYDNAGWLEMEVGAGILLIIVVAMHLGVVISTFFTKKNKQIVSLPFLPDYEYPVQKGTHDARSFVSDGEFGKEEAMYASSEDNDSIKKGKVDDGDVKYLHSEKADSKDRDEI